MHEPKAGLLSLQQVRCFCETARLGSFTAAAEALGVSQPAVAEHVRNLERALGVELFVRAGRGVALTGSGRAFAEHAPAVLVALSDAVSSVEDLSALRSGTIAVGLLGTPTAYRMDELAASFARRHPAVSLRLLGRNSWLSADRVRSGELEAAVVALPIDDEWLDVRPLIRDEVLYVSADPSRTRRPVTIEEMVRAPLVFYDAESGDKDPLRRQLAERAQAQGLPLRPRVELEPVDMALRLVAEGIGDTYLPKAHTLAAYYPAGLHTARFRPALFDTIALATRRDARLSPAVAALVAEMEQHLTRLAMVLDAD